MSSHWWPRQSSWPLQDNTIRSIWNRFEWMLRYMSSFLIDQSVHQKVFIQCLLCARNSARCCIFRKSNWPHSFCFSIDHIYNLKNRFSPFKVKIGKQAHILIKNNELTFNFFIGALHYLKEIQISGLSEMPGKYYCI